MELLTQMINGLSTGGMYALVAIGYTMVYGILRLINFDSTGGGVQVPAFPVLNGKIL